MPQQSLKVKFKKLHEDAKAPRCAKPGDAGVDVFCTAIVSDRDYIEYRTGIAVEIPEGYVGLLFARSGNSKKDLLLCNAVGVIDSGYRGEIALRFKIVTHHGIRKLIPHLYAVGDACGQLIILPYPKATLEEVFDLSESERGTGGFGSTNQ
ncbi:dUTP diphosphatase [Geobacter sp. SVR]|uniref:dUTP diphosphatase n=1 Tax=Geobacter sp. SVR TaxID=2495594 RepID=UPI00143EFB54|nr:dUTP diphosphatase [Geobacter sp. SVR]BCS54076.1 deoxyuridine 5'-triphosphate nucleotidohydrolase [Geobacter sp. SVR]GCF87559.1 deoxyuridine 5'-triphosphate nucleotidohydrolase [Geobacter sp. SVR]